MAAELNRQLVFNDALQHVNSIYVREQMIGAVPVLERMLKMVDAKIEELEQELKAYENMYVSRPS